MRYIVIYVDIGILLYKDKEVGGSCWAFIICSLPRVPTATRESHADNDGVGWNDLDIDQIIHPICPTLSIFPRTNHIV